MELGHDDFGRRNPLLLMNIHRNTSAVISNGYRTIMIQHNINTITMTS